MPECTHGTIRKFFRRWMLLFAVVISALMVNIQFAIADDGPLKGTAQGDPSTLKFWKAILTQTVTTRDGDEYQVGPEYVTPVEGKPGQYHVIVSGLALTENSQQLVTEMFTRTFKTKRISNDPLTYYYEEVTPELPLPVLCLMSTCVLSGFILVGKRHTPSPSST